MVIGPRHWRGGGEWEGGGGKRLEVSGERATSLRRGGGGGSGRVVVVGD